MTQQAKPRLEIAHVLFIDIVGYSKLRLTQQSEALQSAQSRLSAAPMSSAKPTRRGS